jgi:exonuclease SbcC
MRPHRLELAAFGAFPGEVELDLDRLGAGGLVLLCGETGGGKTTLLDALGFALYGVVPGLRGVRDLRSHHAPPDAGPWARLEFSVPGGRFRVARTGGWERPRRRGGGTTRVNPTALLERWTGAGWEAFASRNEDVGHEIGLLLGMRPEQFFQVVMLPQGRFADFLHADHEAREALLKQLFSVGVFERVEQWLVDRAKRAADDHGLARQDLDRVRAKVVEAAGELGEAADAPADAEGPDWAGTLAARGREAASDAERRRDEAATAAAEAQQALADDRAAVRRAEERAALRARLVELAHQAPEIELLAVEVAAAARAGTVRAAVTEAAGRGDEARRAAAAAATARARLAEAADPSTGLSAGADATGAELDALVALAHAESGRLDQLGLALAAADEDEREARTAEAAALEHAQAVAVRVAEIDVTLPARRAGAADRAERARAATRQAPALRDRSTRLAGLADAVRARQVALADVTTTGAAAARARERATELRQQRFDAITAELAAALVDDSPCPVCGALEHPDPTEVRADHVSKDSERAAEAEADRHERAATAAGSVLATVTERVRAGLAGLLAAPEVDESTEPAADGDPDTAAGGGIGGVVTGLLGTLLDETVLLAGPDATNAPGSVPAAAELAAVAAAFAAAAGEAAAAAHGLADADADLAAAADAERHAREDLATRRVLERETGQRAAAARGRAARALAGVPAALRDPARLADRIDAVARFARACDEARRAVDAASRAADEVQRAEQAATAAATEAGFADPAAALAAVRTPEWLTRAEARLRTHRDEQVSVQARLGAAELAGSPAEDEAAAGDVARRLQEAERRDAEARAAYETAVAGAATAARRADRLAALVDEYAGAHRALAPRRAAADQLRHLADLAAGRTPVNLHGMPLASYVLAARLEEVAQAASGRLRAMSGGRYQLVHDVGERRDRRRKAGLGLLVEDAWTGRSRPTATLSGGETFQAALSLALGLADVVSAESGGHRIDALFIDEGFGTLDPESLDEVMNVLDDLRSGGRLVGVVSHVADLRGRIPTQIQVRKGPGGSAVDTTV